MSIIPRKFVPHDYQHLIINHILDNERCAVFAGMGTGKTSSTLTALEILELFEPGPTLVVAPLRVAATKPTAKVTMIAIPYNFKSAVKPLVETGSINFSRYF